MVYDKSIVSDVEGVQNLGGRGILSSMRDGICVRVAMVVVLIVEVGLVVLMAVVGVVVLVGVLCIEVVEVGCS